ncbi:hypothetical protein V1264_019608 [Littorina saxatilis]|uniref:Uncharacterized protein n=2 Tax=Littorina saxatilis TaxID=31220 RepID=A0AAN9BGZ2_9CAEN
MDSNPDITDTLHASADHALIAENGQLSGLSPEDKQVVVQLFQANPKLWTEFRSIVEFCDLVDEGIGANYESLLRKLIPVYKIRNAVDTIIASKFSLAVGFVERLVRLYRHIMTETGTAFVYDISGTDRDERRFCLLVLWALFQTFSHNVDDFRLRFAQTGVLGDMVESLKCMKHIAPDALDGGDVCSRCLGTIHNCCKHSEVRVMVTRMDIVPHVLPFLRNTGMDRDIRLLAYFLLAFVVPDNELDMLELDLDLLTSCLQYTRVALNTTQKRAWSIEEIFIGLSLAMRLDFNKRLFAAKEGAVQGMTQILRSGTEVEKETVMATLRQLDNDPENVKMFKRDEGLIKSLSALRGNEKKEIRDACEEILLKIQQVEAQDGEERPELDELLADQMNTLTILGVGPVQFLLDTLTNHSSKGPGVTSLPGKATSRDQTLRALTALAGDDSCKREILARDGLGLLRKILQEGDDNERTLSAHVVLQLSSRREYCLLLQADGQLMETLGVVKTQSSGDLSDAITNILHAVHTQTATSCSA